MTIQKRTIEAIEKEIRFASMHRDIEHLERLTYELDSINTPQATAISNSCRGIRLYLRGLNAEALDNLALAIEFFSVNGDNIRAATVASNVGLVYQAMGSHTDALENFKKALETFVTARSLHNIGVVSNNIGFILDAIGASSEAIDYFEKAYEAYTEVDNRQAMASVASNIGKTYFKASDYQSALMFFEQAMNLFATIGSSQDMAGAINDIGIVYHASGSNADALVQYTKALDIFTGGGNRIGMANAIGNIGNTHRAAASYPEALECFQRALHIHIELSNNVGMARSTNNIGNVYDLMGYKTEALVHYEKALDYYASTDDLQGIAEVSINIGHVHEINNAFATALDYYGKALDSAFVLGVPRVADYALAGIISTHIKNLDWEEAATMLNKHTGTNLNDPELAAKFCMLNTQLLEHDGNIVDAKTTLHTGLAAATIAGAPSSVAELHKALRDLAQRQNDFAAYIEHNNEFTRLTEEINGKQTAQRLAMMEAEKRIEAERAEKEKHRELLYNTLPKSVADRMIRGEQVTGDHFEHACVLFTDIVGFTSHSSFMQPGDVVTMLATMFAAFDTLCEEHGVMKVKTIGDSYMCFKGDSDATTNASSMAALALALKGACGTWSDGSPIQIRLGIHIGTATAGVIGTQRLQYDVWGDTVNVASRLESTSEPGRIHVSQAFYEVLNTPTQHQLDASTSDAPKPPIPTFTPRGLTDLKGKGEMNTWWMGWQ